MNIHGVGIDVVDVSRVSRLLETSHDRFVQRWFSPEEIAQCLGVPAADLAFAERLAAKEAVWKALRVDSWAGPVPWRLITVVRGSARDPVRVELAGEVRSAAAGVGSILVDWLAADEVAVAVAIAEARGEGQANGLSRKVVPDIWLHGQGPPLDHWPDDAHVGGNAFQEVAAPQAPRVLEEAEQPFEP